MNANTAATPAASGGSDGRRHLATAAVVVAAALQMVVLVPFPVASGLVAPLGAIVALYVLWVGATVGLVLLARRRPLWTPLVPIANAAALFAFITFGERVLGWVA